LLILLSVCLAVAGVMIRVQFLGRSLWLDEAWVANSIRAESLHDALYYDRWLQTTPPLFVILSRIIDEFFGTSNLTLRLLPAFFGIASIPLFFLMAFRLLKPGFALMASVLFVFNPQLVLYSQSLKQYSGDVFSTIALLALGSLYLEKPSDLRFYSLLAGGIAGSFLSYPAMLFWPFVVYVSFPRAGLFEPVAAARCVHRRARLCFDRSGGTV
jgi:predicted membrane-bound mannosyltransferase